jgi:hypothetical protein
MIRFALLALALAAPGVAAATEPLPREDSLVAYHVANRCFAVTDALSKADVALSARNRLDQLLFWGVAASEFGKAANLSEDVQRQDLEAAATKADAEFASKDPKAEEDLAQCEQVFRTAMAK